MKKKHVLIVVILYSYILTICSQSIVVNTDSILNNNYSLYIDSGGDNLGSPTENQTTNDVVILNNPSNSYVGIGTSNPTTKLHIKTSQKALQLVDGLQSNGYVLYSDFSGVARWQSYGTYQARQSSMVNSTIIKYTSTEYNYVRISVTVDPGIWMIDTQLSVYHDTSDGLSSSSLNDRAFLSFCLSDTSTSWTGLTNDYLPGTTKYISNNAYIAGAGYTLIPGAFVVENKTTSEKTYYLWLKFTDVAGTILDKTKFVIGGKGTESFCTAIYLGKTYQN